MHSGGHRAGPLWTSVAHREPLEVRDSPWEASTARSASRLLRSLSQPEVVVVPTSQMRRLRPGELSCLPGPLSWGAFEDGSWTWAPCLQSLPSPWPSWCSPVLLWSTPAGIHTTGVCRVQSEGIEASPLKPPQCSRPWGLGPRASPLCIKAPPSPHGQTVRLKRHRAEGGTLVLEQPSLTLPQPVLTHSSLHRRPRRGAAAQDPRACLFPICPQGSGRGRGVQGCSGGLLSVGQLHPLWAPAT